MSNITPMLLTYQLDFGLVVFQNRKLNWITSRIRRILHNIKANAALYYLLVFC